MFRLSKGAEYAIRSLQHIAGKSYGKAASIEEIAKVMDIPTAYLSKLVQMLAKKGYVRSNRGRDGGFLLTRPAGDITLLEIIEAIEGPIYLNECLIKSGLCPYDNICSVHDVWKECLKRFRDILSDYNLAQLVKKELI